MSSFIDKYLSKLQHKGEFSKAIKIGKVFAFFSFTEYSYLLIKSRIAFLYNYVDKQVSFKESEKLASRFLGNRNIFQIYNSKTLGLIAKILDIYAIALQQGTPWKNYNKAIEVDNEALEICKAIGDEERLFHIKLHIIAAYRDGKISVCEPEIKKEFLNIISGTKDLRIKFCAYLEQIRWYQAKGDLDKAIMIIYRIEDFLNLENIRGKYPNEEREYSSLLSEVRNDKN